MLATTSVVSATALLRLLINTIHLATNLLPLLLCSLNVNMRGDIDRQFGEKVGTEHGADAGSVTYPWSTKHTLWWKLAQVKQDEDGANIGVLWDNRKRPHQYSKPGDSGAASGLTMAGL
eukprot:GHUV01047255.1.p3 GENE.GHUV01047255.1~~GHUV01047255.1.p3  ORF type:complete len:119 (-),score=25.76 GHUV01047255.1:1410-1766(-)